MYYLEVHGGYKVLQDNECDFVISVGGGLLQDTAKGVVIFGSNGGSITDYKGVDMSKNKDLPIVAIKYFKN